MDNTRKGAGWNFLLGWLQSHPPALRETRFFGPPLFAGDASAKNCDVMLFQMDTDILGQLDFQSFVRTRFGYLPGNPVDPRLRATEIEKLLTLSADMENVSSASKSRYYICPTVESTESWCIAAYNKHIGDPEILKGVDLYTAFMTALVESEGRVPAAIYSKCDKNQIRREKFCVKFRKEAGNVYARCSQFKSVYDQLKAGLS